MAYNGWSNHETWCISLWMDNDGSAYWEEQAQECYDNAKEDRHFTRLEEATRELSDIIKDQHEENTPTVEGVYADLLNAALSEVNWYEIAEHLMENVDKSVEVE